MAYRLEHERVDGAIALQACAARVIEAKRAKDEKSVAVLTSPSLRVRRRRGRRGGPIALALQLTRLLPSRLELANARASCGSRSSTRKNMSHARAQSALCDCKKLRQLHVKRRPW